MFSNNIVYHIYNCLKKTLAWLFRRWWQMKEVSTNRLCNFVPKMGEAKALKNKL